VNRLAPDEPLTEAEVAQMYEAPHLKEFSHRVILALKMSLAFMSFGQSASDTEDIVRKACEAMSLPSVHLEIGMRSLQASFAGGPVHLLQVSRGIDADKLVATAKLASSVIHGHGEPRASSRVLQHIFQQRASYGCGVQALAFQGLCTLAAIAAFMGTYEDAAGVAMMTPFVILVQELCKRYTIPLEPFLVALTVGILTPLVRRYVLEVPTCNVPVMYLSPLLIYLPGSQLIYGAYEIQFGSLVNGASQLASCAVRCMFLGMALLLGWQVSGHNAALAETGTAGAVSSLVPASMSCMFPYGWRLIFGVWNIPMLIFAFIGLNIPLRSMLLPGLIGYLSLFLYIALSMLPVPLPSLIVDCIGLFVAGNLASLGEFMTGTPSVLSIIPVLLMLAPGSHVVLSVLESVQQEQDVDGVNVESFQGLMMQGVAYATGLVLALQMWKPLNRYGVARRSMGVHRY